MNIAGAICFILGLACLIVAATIVRERKYAKGGVIKPADLPRVGEDTCTLHLRADTLGARAELEKMRRLLDPHNIHGTIHWFRDEAPYIGEFRAVAAGLGVAVNDLITPPLHSVWRHKNGNLYIVQRITNVSSDGAVRKGHPIGVLYQTLHNHDTWWHRDLSDWHRSFTYVDHPVSPT